MHRARRGGAPYDAPDHARVRCLRVNNADPPDDIVRFLGWYGGLNFFGEPNFRVVWGAQRFCWRTKVYVDRDEHGNFLRRVPECRYRHKYPEFLENWVLEFWKPPTKYGDGDKELWRKEKTLRVDDAPPIPPRESFPSRGDYEFLDFFGGEEGGPLEIQAVKHSIDRLRALRALSPREDEQRELQRLAGTEQSTFNGILDQVKDATRPTTHNPWISLQGPRHAQAGGGVF